MLQSSHLFEEAGHDLAEHGIVLGPPKLDFAQLMKRKGEVVDATTKGVAFLFRKNKITSFQGTGRIDKAGAVSVVGDDGAVKDTLATKNILIASGSEVTPLPGVAVDEKKIVSSTGALELAEVPKHLVVVGAGIIGLELGSVWRRLGSDVTVIEFLDRITPGVDDEVTKHFQRALAKQGLTFKLGSKVTKADASGQGVTLTVEPAKGGAAETVQADIVLVCIGRRPFVEGLGLDKAGVKLSERGRIAVDAHFQTSVPGIYAIGDVIDGPMLAHKASEDGVACVETIAGQKGHVNWDLVPSIIYTQPEVAWVGKTEEQLKAARRCLQDRQVPVHRRSTQPRQRRDGGVREGAGRQGDRQGFGRPHHRRRGGHDDRRSGSRHGVLRLGRGYRPRLPRPSHGQRGDEGSGAGGVGEADSSLDTASSPPRHTGEGRGQPQVGGRLVSDHDDLFRERSSLRLSPSLSSP